MNSLQVCGNTITGEVLNPTSLQVCGNTITGEVLNPNSLFRVSNYGTLVNGTGRVTIFGRIICVTLRVSILAEFMFGGCWKFSVTIYSKLFLSGHYNQFNHCNSCQPPVVQGVADIQVSLQ